MKGPAFLFVLEMKPLGDLFDNAQFALTCALGKAERLLVGLRIIAIMRRLQAWEARHNVTRACRPLKLFKLATTRNGIRLAACAPSFLSMISTNNRAVAWTRIT